MDRDRLIPHPDSGCSPVGKVDPETGDVFEDLENADDEVRRPVVVTDEMRKEDFLISLGLITKKALSELQNKKTVRKRRTTANPHFSNAAIEAKRINQLELAARKAKRKEQTRTRYSLTVKRRDTDRSQSHHHHNKLSDAPVTQSTQLSPYRKLLSQTNKDCVVCRELCEPDNDMIIFCTDCPCLFHATCAVTVQEFASTGYFKCPLCDKKMTMSDEVTDFTCESNGEAAAALSILLSESGNYGKQKSKRGYRTTESTKYAPGQEMITLNQGNNVVSRVSFRSHYDEKRTELRMLMEKKEILELEWTKRKEIYNDTLTTFTLMQQKVAVLDLEGKRIENDVNRLVGFIKSVKIWTEIIDTDEDHHVPHKTGLAIQRDSSSSSPCAAPVSNASTTTATTMTSVSSPISSAEVIREAVNSEIMDQTGDVLVQNSNQLNSGTSQKCVQNTIEISHIRPRSPSETNGVTSIGNGSTISEMITVAAAAQQ